MHPSHLTSCCACSCGQVQLAFVDSVKLVTRLVVDDKLQVGEERQGGRKCRRDREQEGQRMGVGGTAGAASDGEGGAECFRGGGTPASSLRDALGLHA